MDIYTSRSEHNKFLALLQVDAAKLERNLNLRVSKKDFPAFLTQYVQSQLSKWVRSAIAAKEMVEDESYIVRNVGGQRRILPVDAQNSGIIQHNTMWPDGQHQYLQVSIFD